MSFVESLINVSSGYGVALVARILVFPLFGLAVSIMDNVLIGAIFTIISICRSYALRRMFEIFRLWGCK